MFRVWSPAVCLKVKGLFYLSQENINIRGNFFFITECIFCIFKINKCVFNKKKL